MEKRVMETLDELRVASDALNRGIQAVLDGDLEQGRGLSDNCQGAIK